jgi:hypothetical protein
MKLGTTGRNGSVNGVVDALDVGGGGFLDIYTGAPPANPQTAPSGTLLVSMPLSNPAAGNSSGGTATFNTIADAIAAATGAAGWFRLRDAAGTSIVDGTVTATGGGGDITFNTVAFIAGGTVSMTSLAATCPES